MGSIIDKLTEFITGILQSWVLSNLSSMFTGLNESVGKITDEVGQTPQTWNSSIFNMIRTLSDDVVMPIGGMIISFILVYELISMVMDKNNMHDFDTSLFLRYLLKAAMAVSILSQSFDITMAVFDVGNHLVSKVGEKITGATSIDVQETLVNLFQASVEDMEIGELLQLGIETMLVSLSMKVMSAVILYVLYSRMMECYIWISAAPIPYATVINREWGAIGNNYFKGLCALALQGFLIMVFVAIYSVLVSSVAYADDLNAALFTALVYSVLICFSLMKTSSIAKALLGAH